MGPSFVKLPQQAQERVKRMAEQAYGCDDEAVERLARAWLAKMEAFSQKMQMFGMVEVPTLAKDEPRGALVMTYSGSILLLGPPEEGVRIATYSSVGGRSGVPTTAEHEAAVLVTDLVINAVVEFSPGPVARTSEIYKIGVCRTNVAIEEQSARLAEFAGELRADFKELNQTFLGECQ